MKIFGVTGDPVLHSLSPSLFSSVYGGEYKYIYLLSKDTEEAYSLFQKLNLSGLNITAPFKDVSLWEAMCEVDTEAKRVGQVNTLVRKSDNNLCLYNTDINGVIYSLGDFKGKETLILGGGGAAISARYALEKLGYKVYVANRTVKNDYVSLEKVGEYLNTVDLIVNTLNVRIIDSIADNQMFIDAIYHNSPYRDWNTKCNYIGGLHWLIGQAIPSYFLFTNKKPDIELMQNFNRRINTNYNFIGKRSHKLADISSTSINALKFWLYEEGDDLELLPKADIVLDVTRFTDNELKEYINDKTYFAK